MSNKVMKKLRQYVRKKVKTDADEFWDSLFEQIAKLSRWQRLKLAMAVLRGKKPEKRESRG
ncbi:MAG: hypothetical protein JXA50_01705 [Deltaproteobacteria bacterium]|nr:hypothetical protein [Deltaproteobacteria bacterium]